MRRTTRRTSESRGLAEGYRSGLEVVVGAQLSQLGAGAAYEPGKIHYTAPAKAKTYTPDYVLPNGIVIETKGRFVLADRQKHINVKAAWPALDVRFVFSNPKQKISKGSKTTYGDWCVKNGFLYATGLVPVEWVNEPFDASRWTAVQEAMRPQEKKRA
jgi:hypothetical protein